MKAHRGEAAWVLPVSGGLGSMTAEAFTLPIDTIKIRLQLSGELGAQRAYSGLLDALVRVPREEGPTALWKGLSPAMLRQATYSSARVAVYEPIRNAIAGQRGEGHQPTLGDKILAGGTSGALGASFANPTDLVKVRMQADRSGTRYRGVLDAFARIVREEGIRGLYNGVTPNVQRAFAVNAAELATYDHAKGVIVKYGLEPDSVFTHFGASFMAGFAAAVASTPIDLAKTRLMNQALDASGQKPYRGMVDCLLKTARSEGVRSLYKGFLPTWIRIGPWAMIMFMSFEQYRKFFHGLSGDDRSAAE
mmetsp:Transcript_13697/g.43786  ORF Transcript_13697/g.43786 Transcript_13697/m.43786 type:complete len:306 (-) Transcript_13697:383-1300(-)